MTKNNARAVSGFTLIEMLVALVIFSIISLGFARYVSDSAERTRYLTGKTLAAVVAENAISAVRLNAQGPPNVGATTRNVVMASKNWQVTTVIKETTFPDLLRLEVSVSPADDWQRPLTGALVTMIGFANKQ